jgi:hypothetical protein
MARRSAGILLRRRAAAAWRCCWCIPKRYQITRLTPPSITIVCPVM